MIEFKYYYSETDEKMVDVCKLSVQHQDNIFEERKEDKVSYYFCVPDLDDVTRINMFSIYSN